MSSENGGRGVVRIDAGAFAWSASLVMGGAYALCALAFWIAPAALLQLVSWMFHVVRPEAIAGGSMGITLAGAFLGLVQAVAYTYAFAWVAAWLYNGKVGK